VRWLPVWIGLSILLVGGAVVGWFATRLAFAPLRTRPMPGFDIDLPVGEENDYRAADYDDGHLVINDPGGVPAQMQLRWQPGGLAHDDEVTLTNKVFGAVHNAEPRPISPAPKVAIAGQETRSWAVQAGNETYWTTEVVCGARRVSLTTSSSRRGVERLHRRVARSFRCHPDPAREASVGKDNGRHDVPLMFDLEPGWHRYRIERSQYSASNGRAALSAKVLEAPPLPNTEMARKLLGAFPGVKLGEAAGNDWPFEMTVKGKPIRGWMTLRSCSNHLQLLVFAFPVTDGAGDGHELLSRARCRKPDEAPQTWTEWRDVKKGPAQPTHPWSGPD
jgi:hypothetical protein